MKRIGLSLITLLVGVSIVSGQIVPTSQLTQLWLRASAYINWGQTKGTSGYGLRDNAGTIQVKNTGGAWANITPSGSSFAPIDATYITQTANGTLTNEQAMGALGTGLVVNTTTTGVQSVVASVAVNQVLVSNGTGVAPVYSANPVVTSIKGGFKSSDGSSGVTVAVCTSFKDGICVAGM